MADEKFPELTIASSKSDEDIQRDRERAERDRHMIKIEGAMRELAANMLRVIRGAGRPIHLIDQVTALSRAIGNSPEGTLVGDIVGAMEDALQEGLEGRRRGFCEDELRIIESGALRAVAGRIMRQQLQASAGERELWDGLFQWERERQRRRDERQAAEAAYRRAQRALRVKPKRRKTTANPAKKPEAPEPEIEHTGSTAEFMKNRKAQLAKERPG